MGFNVTQREFPLLQKHAATLHDRSRPDVAKIPEQNHIKLFSLPASGSDCALGNPQPL